MMIYYIIIPLQKAIIDCNFDLESNLYNCFEIDDLDEQGNK